MSEEEQELEINEPKSIEDHLSTENVKPTTLNKNGKPRKQLSPEHLEKLARAREKSNEVRKKMVVKKLEDKAQKIKKEHNLVMPEKTPEPEPEPQPEPEVFEYEEEKPKEKPKPKEKAKSKKKTKIIIEQSSEDSDEFEPNDNVVFVKRISRKKKPPEPPPPPPPQQSYEEPPPEPPTLPPREPKMLSAHQMMMRDTYNNMFSGGFLKNNGLPRRY